MCYLVAWVSMTQLLGVIGLCLFLKEITGAEEKFWQRPKGRTWLLPLMYRPLAI